VVFERFLERFSRREQRSPVEEPLVIISLTPGARWIAHNVGSTLARGALEGRYGFKPTRVYANSEGPFVANGGIPEHLQRIVDEQSPGVFLFQPDDQLGPDLEVNVPDGPQNPGVVEVCIPYRDEEIGPDLTSRIRGIVSALATDAQSEYLFVHELVDHNHLRHERGAKRLFSDVVAEGAYWLTYYDRLVLDRLGGMTALAGAPASNIEPLGGGVLIQSHPACGGFDQSPKRADLRRLDAFLTRLAKAPPV
jgi:hypothetical protein